VAGTMARTVVRASTVRTIISYPSWPAVANPIDTVSVL
jgi:hypothetical protein